MRTETADGRLNSKLLAEWFWTDRWMGSSGFLLPLEARGLYREMLTQAWRRGARLPNNHEAIRRATGATPEEWARCWPAVSPYWREDGAALVNDTQLEVYADARERYERRSAAGRRANEVRWESGRKDAGVRTDIRPDKRSESPPSPSPSPSPDKSSTRGLTHDGRILTVHGWQHKELGKRLVSARRTDFDLLLWYSALDSELERTGESLPLEDRARWQWLLDRLYRDAKLPRPSLRARDDEPVGRHVPGHEESQAWLAKQREIDAQIERERAAAAPGALSRGDQATRETAAAHGGAGDE